MRITKVYTRTGDAGKTRLAGGQQVWKDSLRVEAYGTVDELNSLIGIALSKITDKKASEFLLNIQKEIQIESLSKNCLTLTS